VKVIHTIFTLIKLFSEPLCLAVKHLTFLQPTIHAGGVKMGQLCGFALNSSS